MTIFSLVLVFCFPLMMSVIIMKKKDDKKFSALTENLRKNRELWTILNLFKMLLIISTLVFLADYPSL